MPVLEAMATGLPVVTTDCLGVRTFCRHGDNCLMALPDDVAGERGGVPDKNFGGGMGAELWWQGVRTKGGREKGAGEVRSFCGHGDTCLMALPDDVAGDS